jgi:hypothetical protein
VGGELSTYVEKINAYRILVGKSEGRGVDGRKILIFTLKKNLSRNNQQMSRHSTLFPVNSLHVSDTFRVHHQEICS